MMTMIDNELDYQRVARAIRYLEEHADEQPGLAEVAAQLGLSEAHFHRMFRRWAGVTPKDFLQCLTLARAKALLSSSHSLTDASLAVGLSGTSRLHDLFVSHEGMTPGEYKKGGQGLAIRWGVHPTPMGDMVLAQTERGICGLLFMEPGQDALALLRERWPRAGFIEDAAATKPAAAEVAARMRGEGSTPLTLAPLGTAFQVKVWQALLEVPEGHVTSYQQLAAAAGSPGASRAVGTTMANNPIGYLIPCHRVLKAGGAVGDYRWGVERKQALLALEAARVS